MTDETPKKKRKKSKSPTSRALDECRKRGWIAGVVEKFVRFPPPGHLVDLFNCIDIVAITPSGIVGIQATSGQTGGNHAARVHKVLAEPRAKAWVASGARLEVWSFAMRGSRGDRKLWTLREQPLDLNDFPAEFPVEPTRGQ